jgi:hypothetical protein
MIDNICPASFCQSQARLKPKRWKMEDDPPKNEKWKTTSKKIIKKMKTTLKKTNFLDSSLIKGQTFPGIGSAL